MGRWGKFSRSSLWSVRWEVASGKIPPSAHLLKIQEPERWKFGHLWPKAVNQLVCYGTLMCCEWSTDVPPEFGKGLLVGILAPHWQCGVLCPLSQTILVPCLCAMSWKLLTWVENYFSEQLNKKRGLTEEGELFCCLFSGTYFLLLLVTMYAYFSQECINSGPFCCFFLSNQTDLQKSKFGKNIVNEYQQTCNIIFIYTHSV